jgi:hypothetical protein
MMKEVGCASNYETFVRKGALNMLEIVKHSEGKGDT